MRSDELDTLLQDAAKRAARYLEELPLRPVPPSASAVAGLAALDVPCRNGERPSRGARGAGRGGVAGHDGDGWTALLRLRHRRHAPRHAGRERARHRVGSEQRPPRRHAGDRRGGGRGAAMGARRARGSRVARPAVSARRSRTSPRSPRRHAVLAGAGWDVEARGLFGAPEMTVVVGEAHVSLFKALAMLGLGRERVVVVPVDGQGRMRASALPACRRAPSSACRPAT